MSSKLSFHFGYSQKCENLNKIESPTHFYRLNIDVAVYLDQLGRETWASGFARLTMGELLSTSVPVIQPKVFKVVRLAHQYVSICGEIRQTQLTVALTAFEAGLVPRITFDRCL